MTFTVCESYLKAGSGAKERTIIPVWQEGSLLEAGHSVSREAGFSLLGKDGKLQQAMMMDLCCFQFLDIHLGMFTAPADAWLFLALAS